MLCLDSTFYIVLGNYGSGKTELSLALVRHLRHAALGAVALVDLDIVNPYFRSAERADLLNKEGIEVKMPSFALSTVDIPALPAEIQSVFEPGRYEHVVIDVGGDEVGATALGRYTPLIRHVREQMKVLYVVNPFRPLSGNEEDICALFSLIEARSRVRPDWLVNNANLQRRTDVQDLIASQTLLQKVGNRLGLPVAMVTGYERLRSALPADMQERFFPIEPLMLPEWLEDDQA
ncbi:MAG: ParA family protein [Eubacteriales bacterium]|nr:ParA family protein [Eubacteriales bacterium]